jgi:formylglycine-generating enzyme required for sulfatase activity
MKRMFDMQFLRMLGWTACFAVLAGALSGCPDPKPDFRTARIAAAPRVIDPGQTVQFQEVSLLDEGETSVAWLWDFGDGTTSTEQNPTHMYEVPDTYTVTLSLTTTQGAFEPRVEPNMIAVRTPEDPPAAAGETQVFAGITFVWIPAGSFEMGSDNPQWGDLYEQPVRTVTINHGFWMSRTEITQAQWQNVMPFNPSFFIDPDGKRPVEQVGWKEAQAYVTRLNLLENGTFRLPCEAEWEYACRAGTTTEWSFGDDPGIASLFCWDWDNARFSSERVGTRLPNPWGLEDMHGNVAEWCQDYFNPKTYQTDGAVDPAGVAWSYYRSARGGSWKSQVHQCRSAYRDFVFGDVKRSSVGIRLCRN